MCSGDAAAGEPVHSDLDSFPLDGWLMIFSYLEPWPDLCAIAGVCRCGGTAGARRDQTRAASEEMRTDSSASTVKMPCCFARRNFRAVVWDEGSPLWRSLAVERDSARLGAGAWHFSDEVLAFMAPRAWPQLEQLTLRACS